MRKPWEEAMKGNIIYSILSRADEAQVLPLP